MISQLESDLANLIAKHADWLIGRQFQKAALEMADAHFAPSDLDGYINADAFAAALEKELAQAPPLIVEDSNRG
jgi:hypothetical protein